MREARYYRDEAARANRLASAINHPEAREALLKMAKEYGEFAIDFEKGAVEIRHPELMAQQQQSARESS